MESKNALFTARHTPHRRHTLSGAHIRELAEPEARLFLSRHSAPLTEQRIRLALGAFEDGGGLLGVGGGLLAVLAVTGPPDCVATIHLAVAPERRRLKLGTDLMHTVAADHPQVLGPRPKLCAAILPEAAAALRSSFRTKG